MDKRFSILVAFAIGVMLFTSGVSAIASLGITPGRTTIEFEPNLRTSIAATVLNPEGKAINLAISVQGDLANHVILNEEFVSLREGETVREIRFDVQLPKSLKPGLQTAEVIILQLPESAPLSESNLRAVLAVVTQIHVNVPYPGKYAEASLNIANSEKPGEVIFVIPVLNKGNVDIVDAHANVDVYNIMGEKVTSFNTDSISVSSGGRGEIVKKWTSNLPAGTYRAVATLVYDGESTVLEGRFSVGVSDLELQEVTVNDFSLGEIAKFEMLVESRWSVPITGVYTQTVVYDSKGKIMADFKSPSYDIDALSKKVLVSYWDTKGVKKGVYDASIYMNYAGKSVQKDVRFEIEEDSLRVIGLGYVISETKSSGSSTLIVVLIVGIVVLLLLNIMWFLILRKRLARGGK